MLYELRLPRVNPYMAAGRIECVHAACGSQLRSGDRILDLSIDLSGAFSQDCPPVSFYRLVLRETLWLRRISVPLGITCALDQPVAVFSSDPDEPTEGEIARPVRVAAAGIVYHSGMWSGSDH